MDLKPKLKLPLVQTRQKYKLKVPKQLLQPNKLYSKKARSVSPASKRAGMLKAPKKAKLQSLNNSILPPIENSSTSTSVSASFTKSSKLHNVLKRYLSQNFKPDIKLDQAIEIRGGKVTHLEYEIDPYVLKQFSPVPSLSPKIQDSPSDYSCTQKPKLKHKSRFNRRRKPTLSIRNKVHYLDEDNLYCF